MKHPNWYGKVTTRHSTVTKTASKVVGKAARMPEVKNIVLSLIKVVRGGRRRVSFNPINGGIKAIVQGGGTIQNIMIYTNSPDTVTRTLTEAFEK